MGPKLVVCPNCGAYVMSSDNICPRCDYPLNNPAPQTIAVAEPTLEDTPANGATGPVQLPDLDAVEAVEEVDRSLLPTTEQPAVPSPDEEPIPELELDEEQGETLIVGAQIDEPAVDEFDLPLELDLPDESDLSDEPDLSDESTPLHGPTVEPPPFGSEKTEPNLAWVIQPEENAPAPSDQAASSDALPAAESSEPDELSPLTDDSKPYWTLPKKVVPNEEPTLTQLPVAIDNDEDDDLTQARIPAEEEELAPYIVPPAPFSPPPDEYDEEEEVDLDLPVTLPPAVAPPAYMQAPPAHTPSSAIPAYTPPTAPPPAYYAPQPAYAPSPYSAPAYGGYPAYGAAPALPLIAQRVQTYVNGGYRLRSQSPRQAVLSYGKRLGIGTWIVALASISGVLWYILLLALSGFHQDRAYLDLAPDGRLYEEGPGAAHVRASRARSGRRWGLLGMILFLLSFVLLLGLIGTALFTLSQDRYQAALRKAYPEITYFENHFSDETAAQADVDLMKTGLIVFSILSGIATVGVWGGFTLWVIGKVHASAYRVHVPPLPGYD